VKELVTALYEGKHTSYHDLSQEFCYQQSKRCINDKLPPLYKVSSSSSSSSSSSNTTNNSTCRNTLSSLPPSPSHQNQRKDGKFQEKTPPELKQDAVMAVLEDEGVIYDYGKEEGPDDVEARFNAAIRKIERTLM